jgi:hypothetical protein
MKGQWFLTGVFFSAILCSSCHLINGNGLYKENNPDAFGQVALVSSGHEGGNMNKLSFGTSARPAPVSQITLLENEVIEIQAGDASNRTAGKIAGSEDGITYYFKQVGVDKNFQLTADATVISYGTEGIAPNGQEGFGLMARDYVPQFPGYTMEDLKAVPGGGGYYAGSTGGTGNMLMVGGVKRGVRVYWRTGVVDPSGECITNPQAIANADKAVFDFIPRELPDYSEWENIEDRPDYPSKGTKYTLYLEKTNSGFKIKITPPSNKGGDPNNNIAVGQTLEYFIAEPDLLASINKEYYYVGFFAARNAKIQISNINYLEANTEDCAPRLDREPEMFTPSFAVVSPAATAAGSYTLYARSNVEGTMMASLNGAALPEGDVAGEWLVENSNASGIPFMLFTVPASTLTPGDNVFRLVFYPDKAQERSKYLLTSSQAITLSFVVNRKTYGDPERGGAIYVSPDARRNGAGTYANPLDLDMAIAYVRPGQKIIMKNGVYKPLSVTIPRYNDGAVNGEEIQYKELAAEDRDQVIIDFDKQTYANGFVLEGNYWKISGIQVRNTPDKKKGFTIMGSHSFIEWVKTYNNGDTGMQISGRSNEPKSQWPAYNTISKCESFNNKDAAQEDADGYAAKLTVGEGNRFEWCVAHHNCDDGWDLFSKKETGVIGAVTMENCITYQNGWILDDAGKAVWMDSGGNGFKLGGEGLSVKHEAINCLAFDNGASGFTSNSNPAILLTRCTAFNNLERGYTTYGSGTSSPIGLDAVINQLLSLYDTPNPPASDNVDASQPAHGYIWKDGKTQNSAGRIITSMVNKTPPFTATNTAPFESSIQGQFLERHDNGAFKLNGFAKPVPPPGTSFITGTPGATGLYEADEKAGST